MPLETPGAGARLTDATRSRLPFSRPPLALIVDDQEWSARSLESVLGPSGFAAVRLPTARLVLEQVHTISPDLLMIKSDLPELSGVELCSTLRSREVVEPTTPILITSAEPPTREQRLEALRAGAWEAIALPLGAEELLLKLHVYVRAKLEVDRVREECLVDPETGVYGVQGLLTRIREVGLDAARHHRSVSCAVIAPDEHLPETDRRAADRRHGLPGRMAHLISSVARRSDVVGRVGRTEFAVLAPSTDPTGILALARRFINAGELLLRGRSGTGAAPLHLRVGCYGVEDFGDSFVEPVDLLAHATSALRRAQRGAGSAPVCFFDPVAPMA
ncbi:MAG TPA: response regulator [Longimicrobiaceae bacterium]|nr:response regulator [Longimicrobiaceae bacterium]